MIFRLIGESEEKTELEKLLEAEKLANQSSEFDTVYEKTKETQQEQAAEVSDSIPSFDSGGSSSDSSSDSSDEDGEDDFSDIDGDDGDFDEDSEDAEDEEKEPVEEEEGEEEPETESTNAAESIRNFSRVNVIVAESMVGSGVSFLGNAIKGTASYAVEGAHLLAALGVRYLPIFGEKLYKTVYALFIRALRMIFGIRQKLALYVRTRDKSLERISRDLESLKAELQELKDNPPEAEEPLGAVTDYKTIRWFMVGNTVSATKSSEAMLSFAKEVVSEMSSSTLNDISSLSRILELKSGSSLSAVQDLMRVPAPRSGFVKKDVDGYVQDDSVLDTYVYNQPLPNATLAIVSIPKPHLENTDDRARAYQLSGAFLGVEESRYQVPSRLDYMKPEQTEQLIKTLEVLVDVSKTNQSLLKQIGRSTKDLTLGYRHYFERLVAAREKVSIKDSLIETVTAKQAFINRTYLPCAMDIQDYTHSFLTRAIRYARESIRQAKG